MAQLKTTTIQLEDDDWGLLEKLCKRYEGKKIQSTPVKNVHVIRLAIRYLAKYEGLTK